MTYFRTAKLKVHNPSGRKLRCVQGAVETYTRLYLDTIRRVEADADLIEALSEMSKTQIQKELRSLLPNEATGSLRSSLLDDLSHGLLTYFQTPDANFPAPSAKTALPLEELLEQISDPSLSLKEENELKWAMKREEKDYVRPFQFARFRDAPLLKSTDGTKMWVALKLPDVPKQTVFPECRLVRPIRKERDWSGKKSRSYMLFPLEVSQWHVYRFFGPGTPKTCKVTVEDEDIYVHYSFAFETPERRDPRAVLGIDRGRDVAAAYGLAGRDGVLRSAGSSMSHRINERLKSIDKQIAADQKAGRTPDYTERKRFIRHASHSIANEIVEMAAGAGALIAFEDLTNIKGATGSRFDTGLKRSQYTRIYDLVEEKAEEKALQVVKVHPAYTSITCPACGTVDKASRISRDQFRCVTCGHEAHADLNASHMIALRGLWYLEGGKKKTGCQTFSEYVQMKIKEAPERSLTGSNGASASSHDTSASTLATGEPSVP